MAQYSIVGGPSKFDLMLALFDSTVRQPRHVIFELGSNGPHFETRQVVITVVSRVLGSSEDWNFMGYVFCGGYTPSNEDAEGYFSTKTRKGSMKTTNIY